MQVLKLKVSDEVFDKFTWLLEKFSADEIEIIDEQAELDTVQRYLEDEYRDIKAGRAQFVGIEEAERHLEDTIRKHENSI